MFLFVEKCICQSAETSVQDKHSRLEKVRTADERSVCGEGASSPVWGVVLTEWARSVFTNDEKGIFLS